MVLLDNCFLWPMAAVHDPRFELLPSVPQHEKPHGWKPILQKWQCYICCWWPFFGGNRMKAASPMGSKHYKSDGRHCWTAKGTKLQNKPHLVPFNVRASWSADKLFCWPSYMAFQWKVLNWWHQQRKPFSSYDCNLLEFRCPMFKHWESIISTEFGAAFKPCQSIQPVPAQTMDIKWRRWG